MLEYPCIQDSCALHPFEMVATCAVKILSGADNQQGSPSRPPLGVDVTPQRLHAELLAVGAKGLESYLQGALRDGTHSARHNTHRFCQSEKIGSTFLVWHCRCLVIAAGSIEKVERGICGCSRQPQSSWTWIRSITACRNSERSVVRSGLLRCGWRNAQECSFTDVCAAVAKDKVSLENVKRILDSWNVECGRVHNPSVRVDPDYWRVFVRSRSHESFMRLVGSWNPVKHHEINTRMKI